MRRRSYHSHLSTPDFFFSTTQPGKTWLAFACVHRALRIFLKYFYAGVNRSALTAPRVPFSTLRVRMESLAHLARVHRAPSSCARCASTWANPPSSRLPLILGSLHADKQSPMTSLPECGRRVPLACPVRPIRPCGGYLPPSASAVWLIVPVQRRHPLLRP